MASRRSADVNPQRIIHLSFFHMDSSGRRGSELGLADISLCALVRATIARLNERHWKRSQDRKASMKFETKKLMARTASMEKEERDNVLEKEGGGGSLLDSVLAKMKKNNTGVVEKFSLEEKENTHLTSEWVNIALPLIGVSDTMRRVLQRARTQIILRCRLIPSDDVRQNDLSLLSDDGMACFFLISACIHLIF